jgi:ATP-dependent Lon protease
MPETYVKGVTFHYVKNVKDVWNFALSDELVDNPVKYTIPEEKNEKKES